MMWVTAEDIFIVSREERKAKQNGSFGNQFPLNMHCDAKFNHCNGVLMPEKMCQTFFPFCET